MRETMSRSLAPGTVKNREAQAALYIKFMLIYGFDYLSPDISDLTMYAQFLANTYNSPATVRNHISGAKMWVQFHRGNIQHFAAQEMSMMSKSILERSTHIPSPAAPVGPREIRSICAYIDGTRNPHPAFKAAILIAFATFLRVSNVLSPTTSSWGGAHTLLARDIKLINEVLYITIRSTKTRRHGSPHLSIVHPVEDGSVCPVRAWRNYLVAIQPCPLGPAFMIDDMTPLTPGPVVTLMRAALHQAGVDNS